MEKMVNAEFFDALEQLEKEKGIPVDYMLDRVGQALITAYKRDNDGMTDNVYVEPNREEKTIRMYVRKTVVRTEDLYEPYEEITLEEAADYKVNPQVGDIIDIDIPYPRDQSTKMSPRFLELKNEIWSQVYQEYLSVRK